MAKKNSAWLWGGVGCCLGCIGLPLLFVTLVGGVGALGFWQARGPTEKGKELARNHPRVIELLGEPVEIGSFPMGNVNFSDDGGRVDVRYSISGPKGEGHLHIVAHRDRGDWTLEELELAPPEGSEIVNLLEAPALEAPELEAPHPGASPTL